MRKSIIILFIISLIFSCTDKEKTTLKSYEKSIIRFTFQNYGTEAIIDNSNRLITVTLPAGTDLTKLTPTILISEKATITPASNVELDFSKQVFYTVTAEDGSNVKYTVKITVSKKAPNPPTIIKVTSSTILLKWDKIDEANKYKLYKNSSLVYTGDSLNYLDIGLLPETPYSYSLSYSDEKEESPRSESLVVSTLKKSILDVVDDPSYAEYLPYEWSCLVSGRDMWFDAYNLTFDKLKTDFKYTHVYNHYYYISSSEIKSTNYKFIIDKNIIYIYDDLFKKYIKFYRIERINDEQFKAYSVYESSSSYSEYYVGIFYRKYFVEKNSDEVIKNNAIKAYLSGIWKEEDNTQSSISDKNISYDFTSGKNFYWKNYEMYNGSKNSEKYEFKIDDDSYFFTRKWGIAGPWNSSKIKYDNDSKKLIVGSKYWFR